MQDREAGDHGGRKRGDREERREWEGKKGNQNTRAPSLTLQARCNLAALTPGGVRECVCAGHYTRAQQVLICTVLCWGAQASCPTLCNPMDCSPPGSSVHGDPLRQGYWVGCHALLEGNFLIQGLWTQVSRTAGGLFTSWATRKVQFVLYPLINFHIS